MKRPTRYDADVIALAVEKLRPQIEDWLEDEYDDEVPIHLARFLPTSYDGYEFAKNLEHVGWSPDAELVDILDGAWSKLTAAVHVLTARWIESYRVFPIHGLHDAVLWKDFPCEITHVDSKYGTYTLFSPQEGHVREGIGTHGHIVEWEKIDGQVNAKGLTVVGPLFQGVPCAAV